MSIEITTAFVEQYKSNVFHLAQQKGSRLRDTVKLETVNGKSHFFERIGSVAAEKRTSRHADTPRMDTPHSRRKVTMDDYEGQWMTALLRRQAETLTAALVVVQLSHYQRHKKSFMEAQA